MKGSMTASTLIDLLRRLNPSFDFVVGSRRQVGIYIGTDHVGGLTSCDDLPVRTVLDSTLVIEKRGWMDVIAGLYGAGFLPRLHPELVRLMGITALETAERGGALPLDGVGDAPPVVIRKAAPARHLWMGRDPMVAA